MSVGDKYCREEKNGGEVPVAVGFALSKTVVTDDLTELKTEPCGNLQGRVFQAEGTAGAKAPSYGVCLAWVKMWKEVSEAEGGKEESPGQERGHGLCAGP